MSDQDDKPVLDEQTLARLLEAAYVLQEHNRQRQAAELSLDLQSQQLRQREHEETSGATPVAPEEQSEEVSAAKDYTLTLAQIVETQRQIQVRHLASDHAMALIAERVTQIGKATGAGIGIIRDGKVVYRAVQGKTALPRSSEVLIAKALCSACLRTGQVIRCTDVNPEFLLDAEECQRRGIQSLIAVPIYHDGGIAGGLELYFAKTEAFSEQDVHTCQLMAGLVTEALARDEEVTGKESQAPERAAMLEAARKLKANLAAGAVHSTKKDSETITSIPANAAATGNYLCRKCGHELVAEEQFCGKCGTPRLAAGQVQKAPTKQALRRMRQARKKSAKFDRAKRAEELVASPAIPETDSLKNEKLPDSITGKIDEPLSIPEIKPNGGTKKSPLSLAAGAEPEEDLSGDTLTGELVGPQPAKSVTSGSDKDSLPVSAETALTKSDDVTWSSAASARDFLEQLAVTKNRSALANFWHARRGDLYLALAVILVAVVIRWGIWSNHSVSATGTGYYSHRKPAPDADLSVFDKLLISVGLAEPPEAPEDKGNPDTQVWVDIHTALYYCPGTDLYGKTPKGKFTTQRDAQLDQFEPASRKACP